MVAKVGGYFGHLFKGYQGVTQDDSLSLTIFNVVVDAIIRHWVTVVTPTTAVLGGLGITFIYLLAHFYADNGLVASTQPERLHTEFDVLTVLFHRVGLWKNTAKTVGMVCQPCHAPGRVSEEAYV